MGAASDRIGAKLRRGVGNRVKALALGVTRELKLKPPLGTPVQDGNARANWIPTAGAPYAGPALDVASAGAAAAQGTAQVAAWSLGQGDLFVTNRTPYIRLLNDGHSKQSPALFVEAGIERAKSKVGLDGIVAEGQSASDAAAGAAEGLASFHSPFGGSDD